MRLRTIVALALVTGLLAAPAAASANTSGTATVEPKGAALSAPSGPRQQQTTDLMAYNGYYALSTGPDAFFYVNTTMTATDGGAKQTYAISLDVSLDGTRSFSPAFTGTFVGNRLVQEVGRGPGFDLRFTRLGSSLGPTVKIAGTITLPGKRPVRVTGTTYSNPTPASFWGGETYYAPATTPGGSPTPAVRMTKNGAIYVKNRSSPRWVRADSYTYNLDMYYFALKDRDLIMGTAGQQGKVANQMITAANGTVTQQDLVVLPDAQVPTTGTDNWYPSPASGPQLGDFSGYYALQPGNSRAFVSIESTSLADPSLSSEELTRVLVSVSTDGTTVRSWYYDVQGGMTFDGSVLSMPAQGITLRFERRYDRQTGTLFNMRGTIDGRAVRGQSSFNSIPVPAFAGTMRDKAGQHTLVITPSGEVTLDGTAIPNYQYVPTMYILAGPVPGTTPTLQPVTLLSLGFSGGSGRTAIVTMDFGTPQAETFTVFSIPNP